MNFHVQYLNVKKYMNKNQRQTLQHVLEAHLITHIDLPKLKSGPPPPNFLRPKMAPPPKKSGTLLSRYVGQNFHSFTPSPVEQGQLLGGCLVAKPCEAKPETAMVGHWDTRIPEV